MFASRFTCDVAAGHAWDTVQICEQKWQATLLIPDFTPGMPAKLTQVQLCRHAGSRALRWLQLPVTHVLICPRSVPGSTGSYVAHTSPAYENQALAPQKWEPELLLVLKKEWHQGDCFSDALFLACEKRLLPLAKETLNNDTTLPNSPCYLPVFGNWVNA